MFAHPYIVHAAVMVLALVFCLYTDDYDKLSTRSIVVGLFGLATAVAARKYWNPPIKDPLMMAILVQGVSSLALFAVGVGIKGHLYSARNER